MQQGLSRPGHDWWERWWGTRPQNKSDAELHNLRHICNLHFFPVFICFFYETLSLSLQKLKIPISFGWAGSPCWGIPRGRLAQDLREHSGHHWLPSIDTLRRSGLYFPIMFSGKSLELTDQFNSGHFHIKSRHTSSVQFFLDAASTS